MSLCWVFWGRWFGPGGEVLLLLGGAGRRLDGDFLVGLGAVLPGCWWGGWAGWSLFSPSFAGLRGRSTGRSLLLRGAGAAAGRRLGRFWEPMGWMALGFFGQFELLKNR